MEVKEYVESILDHARELAKLDGYHVLPGRQEEYIVTALCDALCTTVAMSIVEACKPLYDRLEEIEARLAELEKLS
jgi:hypothetical protein